MAYTTINDPSAYFQTALYDGTGNDPLVITNTGYSDLQPDLIWWKNRTNANDHRMVDTSRGLTKHIVPNLTSNEATNTGYVQSVQSDGYTVAHYDGSVNASPYTYVGWQWKADGGTTSTDTSGDIDSTIQVNTTAGISIVLYEGNGVDGATVPHGLGVAPAVVHFKARDPASERSWNTIAPALWGDGYWTNIFDNDSAVSDSGLSNWTTNSSNIVLGDGTGHNIDGTDYVAYCFTDIQGYSKFGEYTGNNDADGPFVYTGFKPAYLLVTRTNTGGYSIFICDNTRSEYNPISKFIKTDVANVESTSADINFLSNGFKCISTTTGHNSAGTFFYMAFAEQPFVTAGGIPATAR